MKEEKRIEAFLMSLDLGGNQMTLRVDSDSSIGRVVELLEQDLNQPKIKSLV